MRAVFKDVVGVSLLGPFFAFWYYIADYFLWTESSWVRDDLDFWLWGVFYITISLLEAVIQIIVVPGVFDWSDRSNYLDNDREKKSLLAVLF